MREDRSILDAITQEVSHLEDELGSDDRTRVADYLDNVREIERRIQRSEKQAASQSQRAVGAGWNSRIVRRARQADVRSSGAGAAGRHHARDHIHDGARAEPADLSAGDAPDPHHATSHHQNDAKKIEALTRIQNYHITIFAYYLNKLRSIPDGEGTLLDHTLLLYGSNMSNSNLHNHFPLPVLVAGGAGQIKGGGI
jgi:hypothetical protein